MQRIVGLISDISNTVKYMLSTAADYDDIYYPNVLYYNIGDCTSDLMLRSNDK